MSPKRPPSDNGTDGSTLAVDDSLAASTAADSSVNEAFRKLVLDASLSDASHKNEVVELLRDHLGMDPARAAQINYPELYAHGRERMQAALDKYLADNAVEHEYLGVQCPIADPALALSLSKLFAPASLNWPGVSIGSPTWERRACGYERTMRCLAQGLVVFRNADGPAAIWVWEGFGRNFTVIAATAEQGNAILEELLRLREVCSPFIGEVFTIPGEPMKFLPRPAPFAADDLILPSDLLERIDQHAVAISRGRERLMAAGQHLKRGLLLYGPPGTGKTHTIRYLISRLPAETTVFIVPATACHAIPWYLKIMGDSAMVVIDDVDAVAEDRSLPGARGKLFELLEALDGLEVQGDVLFVLTTNRLEVLEPAVSARPGRIDEAIEVPRPDADCRRRLFARYRQGIALTISDDDVDAIIERTDGVTASFIRELLRRSIVVAVENGSTEGPDGLWPVTAADVFGALDEMLDPANPASRMLLGAEPDLPAHHVAVRAIGGDR